MINKNGANLTIRVAAILFAAAALSACQVTIIVNPGPGGPTTTTSTTTTPPVPCAGGGVCSVGDAGPGGGVVFYVDENRPIGGRRFEVAPSTWCGGFTTNCGMGFFDTPAPGATGVTIGTGEANTQSLIAASSGHPGLDLISNYRGGGKDDWFIPSKDEIDELSPCFYPTQDHPKIECGISGDVGSLFSSTRLVGGSPDQQWILINIWYQQIRFWVWDGTPSGWTRYSGPVNLVRSF